MYENRSYERRGNQNGNRAPKTGGGNRPNNKPATPKGHDAVLKAIQDDGRLIYITLQSGEKIVGKVAARDKFTISIREVTTPKTYIVYKHAIESFYAEDKAQVTE